MRVFSNRPLEKIIYRNTLRQLDLLKIHTFNNNQQTYKLKVSDNCPRTPFFIDEIRNFDKRGFACQIGRGFI